MLRFLSASRANSSRLWAALLLMGCALTAAAATDPKLYEATVPLADKSEKGQAAAMQDALRDVLVRMTGRAEAGSEPALAVAITNARRYVQQYQVTADGQLFVGFDGRELEKVVAAADPNGLKDVTVVVTGIHAMPAYAAVTDYLESLRSVRTLAVDQLAGDAVTYRLRVLGTPTELGRAIEANGQLRPDASTAANPATAVMSTLSYQFRP